MLNVIILSVIILPVITLSVIVLNRGARKLTGENLKPVWAKFSIKR
jgi:hypothetical protein